jgi:hypothetical protein
MNNWIEFVNALCILAIVGTIGAIVCLVMVLIWTYQRLQAQIKENQLLKAQKKTNPTEPIPALETHAFTPIEQKAFALLYGRSVPQSVVQENLGDGWNDTIKALYNTGYVSILTPSDKSETRYDLTTKGNKHHLAFTLPTEKKDDDKQSQ